MREAQRTGCDMKNEGDSSGESADDDDDDDDDDDNNSVLLYKCKASVSVW